MKIGIGTKLVQRILARRRPSCLHHHPPPNTHTQHTPTHSLGPRAHIPLFALHGGLSYRCSRSDLTSQGFALQAICGKELSLGPASHTGPGGFAKFCKERPTRWTTATCGPSAGTAAAAVWDIYVVRGCVPGAAVGTSGRGPALALWISQTGLQRAARAASWCLACLPCHHPAGESFSLYRRKVELRLPTAQD